MSNIIKKYMQWCVDQAVSMNMSNIIDLLDSNSASRMLDCGCDDGRITLLFSRKVETSEIFGIEINPTSIEKARSNGIETRSADLNGRLPFDDNFFDVICANQVIEHLYDTDKFLEELHRILKDDGYAVISTENLASWHNIGALLFGWQPFSLTNVSSGTLGIGNPLALHRGRSLSYKSWEHVRVYSYRGLKEVFEVKGFKVESILGAGYYPLHGLFARVDPRHSAFLTLKVRKSGDKKVFS